MRLKDCDSCLVYGTDNRPLAKARVEMGDGSGQGIKLFFTTFKLRSIRLKTIVDLYDRSQGVLRSRCELVIQRNSLPTRAREPWMATCDVIDVLEVYQRQKDLRVNVNIRTEFLAEKGWYFPGIIGNISAGGIFLITAQTLKKNDYFTFHYRFTSEECEVRARVIRVGGLVRGEYSYGCQFVGISAETEAAIRKFVFTEQVKRQSSRERERE